MFGKKKSEGTAAGRRTIVRETLERIIIRGRRETQIAYCTSCGKLTRCLTPEQAQEIFGRSQPVDKSIDKIHLLTAGEATLICGDSLPLNEAELINEEI